MARRDAPQGQSVLLLSDGVHNVGAVRDVLAAALEAQAMDVPVFALILGGKVGIKNVSVTPRSPQELAFVGQTVPAVVQLQTLGLGRRAIDVSLWKDGQELQTVSVSPDEHGSAEATFDLREPEPGLFRYEVRAADIPAEATTADNRATMLFRVVLSLIHI